MQPLLEARGVTKRYGRGDPVLVDVSLELHKGELKVIEGRSGSGKSTLIKLLAGLDHPTSGEIRVMGADMAGKTDAEVSRIRLHQIGLVFQAFNLLPDLTLAENVELPMRIASREGARERVAELFGLLGIGHLADARPNQVSGGEQQRAAIARALANAPAVILADEPTGSLDRKNAENVMNAFADVNREIGTSILIATHDPIVLEAVGRGYVIDEGRLGSREPTRRADAADAAARRR